MKHFTQNLRWLFVSLMLVMGVECAWAETVTYAISSKNTLSPTGTAPEGSTATLVETYSTSKQMTADNSQTLTLSGFQGCTISNITLSMRSNKSSGAGKLSYSTDGGENYTYLAGSAPAGVAFNTSDWHDGWSTSYVDVSKDVEIEATSSDLIIKIEATENSLYCESYKITYTNNSSAATTTTIDASGITNTDVYTSTAAGTLSATVTSGGNPISGATVTWTSSNENVAIVASDGMVTLVGAGTTAITASYAGESGTYRSSSDTYDLTVTSSAPTNQLVTVDATTGDITFLFNDTGWGLPEGSDNRTSEINSYTNSGYTITLCGSAQNGYYYYGYLLMGKSGAYLQLPAFDFDVERIEVTGTGTASTNVGQNIYVGDEPVSTATTGAKNVTNSYTIAPGYQAAGNIYKLQVTSAHNTQITQIKVIKKNTAPSLTFSAASASVHVGETFTQEVNAYNTGENTITYTTSNAEIATVDENGVVTGVAEGTVTITASVTVDVTEYTATYELTVNKNDPELSFETAVVTITESETYAGQTVTKPSDITDDEITYSSNNAAVATVDAATGAITLAGGIGSATITASFAGNAKYNAANATYTLKVTEASAVLGDYVKITSTDDLTDGEYLIVYEDGPVAFDGGLTTLDGTGNNISVTIDTESSPYTIEATETVDAATFTITAIDGGYSILSASGYYIGRSATNNGLNASTSYSGDYLNTITFDNGNVVIKGKSGNVLRYNKTSGQERFRYFGSGQQAIQLYKKSTSSVTVATPTISPETGTYTERPQTVTISCSTVPAAGETLKIYYTTNGSNPTTSSTQYTASFSIKRNTTVKAIAVLTKDGTNYTSRVASSVITMKVNAPVFSPATGTSFDSDYNVSISADPGLTIYYITQDNKIFKSSTGKTATYSESTGELVSTAMAYSGALTFGQSMMVTAICMDADGNLSDPVTAQYTYTGKVVPPYYSSFSASEGDFVVTQTADENTITGNGVPEWKMNSNTGASAIANWGEERYYMYVRGTSGNTNQDRTRWYGTADLTSPFIDLTDKSQATFSFIHAGHHFYADPNTSASATDNTLETTLSESTAGSAVRTSCHVYIDDYGTDGVSLISSTDVSDDVNWFEQAFRNDIASSSNPRQLASSSTTSRSGSFPRANSGDISLATYQDHIIKIRFSYASTPESYGTWNIDQVTINAVDVEELEMNERGWTTYVFDHDIDAYATTQNYISGGEETLQIYKVTEFDFDEVVLQQLGKFEEYTTENNSERYIPAKTPVIIHGPASETISFEKYTAPSMLPTVKNNLLIGSLSPNLAVAPVGSGIRYFVLQWKTETEEPYFNKVKEGREIPDHKAYLNGADEIGMVSTKTNSVKGIYVMGGDDYDEATGIINHTEDAGTVLGNEWFTIQGVRIERPTVSGIYINNGKKVYVK